MKNIFLTLTLLLSAYISQAQIVNIPDANFKNALINTNCVDTNADGYGDIDADTNNDGEIQVSEAEAVINLHIAYQEITSLEGIQNFIHLEELFCDHNQLTSIDVSQNTNLKSFFCHQNQLSSIDISQNPNLEYFQCVGNQLTTIDLSHNPNLIELACGENLLTSLNVAQNPNLLVLGFHLNQLSSIDLTQNTDLHFLDCRGNQMEILELSQNLNIHTIWCYDNLLTNLDLSQNINLEWLYCYNNLLSNLNLKNGNNTNTHTIWAYGNSNLTCIQVDDENASYPECPTNNIFGWCKDDWAVYNEECELGVSDLELYKIKIYPNPVQNILNIISDIPIDKVKIYTLQGKLLNETRNNQIDVSKLSTGIYFVSITINGKSSVEKFVKK